MITKPMNVVILEGEEAVFETTVTGNPRPEVTWYSEEGELVPSDRVECARQGYKHTLVLRDCEVEESGNIRVEAVNEVGDATATVKLTVKGSDLSLK